MVEPSVLGTTAAGKQLTGLSGSWGGLDAITYHFQWFRCNAAGAGCLSVHGATSPTYFLADKDVGKTLGLTVYATDSSGTAAAYSSLVGPVAPRRPLLESTAQPIVTGPPVVGKVLQVTTGTWSPTPPTLAYRWERCNANARACGTIANATSSSYTVTSSDLGHALLAIVQATNGSTSQNAFSTATPAVVAHAGRPVATVPPSVTGAAVVGRQLGAQSGVWQGVGSIAFGYAWFRCDPTGAHCKAIPGATQAVYTLGARDAGRTIGLMLTATDSVGKTDAYATLAGPVAAPNAPLTPVTVPTVVGTARVGGSLSVDQGQWSSTPRSYTYSWLRCNRNARLCIAIPGATRTTYVPVATDAGHTIVVQVTASAGGASQAVLTAATAPIVT
jgi:hypothetical protein